MAENLPFEIPTINTARPDMFGGVSPLSDKDEQELAGRTLGARGLEAEKLEIEKREALKAAYKQVEQEEELKAAATPKRGRGRPRKVKTDAPPPAPAPAKEYAPLNRAVGSFDEEGGFRGMRITMDFAFVHEIAVSQNRLFKLIEELSSGNPRLSSPANGGLDFEYHYDLRRRLQEVGLV